ncbi:outer membrane protein assembly factor BamC [Alcaligenaceae bacterium CGII-47]|nr:outer membrane protein assembly factor BamC [Alcaligenaceae bacterium CGII-47]
MTTHYTPTPWAKAALALSLVALAGCSTIGELTGQTDSIEYKSTVSGDPLTIPPDLTKANQNPHYQASEGTARFSDYAAGQQAQRIANPADRVLPKSDGIQVMRDGTLRWLVVDQPAEKIYPRVIEFWGDQGFTIQSQDPLSGLIQTDWAENRAKIPEGWLRSALGKVLDQVFDSGERDRFTTRMERVSGKTEIYISHQHMEETPTSDGTGFKWVYGKEDPGVNAAMLARLMVSLGTDIQQAQEQISRAEADPTGVAAAPQLSGGQASITLNEPFDRAWRRVGVALDSARFTVEDRNRANGDYFIRYLDTDTGEKIEQQTIFGRMFGSRNMAEPLKFRVHVADQGASSVVTVQDEQGVTLTDDTARRVISVMSGHLNEASAQ